MQLLGPSGSGKTLALSLAVRRLARHGLRVAVVKHSHHSIDLPGKDTDRLRRSGARFVLFASNDLTLMSRCDPLALLRSLPVDAVLVEGYGGRRLSAQRFTIRSPKEAPAVAERIVRSVGAAKAAVIPLHLEGRRPSPPPEWREFLANLMTFYGIRRIALPSDRRGTSRPRGVRSARRRAGSA